MQVFILGAQRIRGWDFPKKKSLLSKKLISGKSFLDWNISTLNETKINSKSIFLIAGYRYKEIQSIFPNINFIINPDWEKTHVSGSLRHALNYWNGDDLLIFYADTLIKPNNLKEFLSLTSENLIATSNLSNDNDKYDEISQELVEISNQYFTSNLEKESLNKKQFTGLTFLKKDSVSSFKSFLDKNKTIHDNSRLSSALQDFLIKNPRHKFKEYDISDSWVELDSLKNITRFIFGSKAETLQRLKPFIKKSFVCDQIYFNINDWVISRDSIIQKIQNEFDKNIIVRSSSLEEDSWYNSMAGSFLSIKDIDPNNQKKLIESIQGVINSYSKNDNKPNLGNQVLIQPYIKNVSVSGVVFSKNLEDGSPYYCISYDHLSKDTDRVTSGNSNQINTFKIYRGCDKNLVNSLIKKIILSVDELESILNYSSLDIEFIIDNNDDLYVVQIRPITSHKSLFENEDFIHNLNKTKLALNFRLKNKTHLYGDSNVLSDMTDWNPAEMIGANPKPLSLSLYQNLITDSTWRISRGMIGYNNPSPEKLLFCLGGHPYIDVRNSFNNLIPNDLSPVLSNKLVNHYINLLKQKKHFHDKVEFEIVISCFSPDIEKHLIRLEKDNFTVKEIRELKTSLKKLTNDIIYERNFKIDKLIDQTLILENKTKKILQLEYKVDDIPSIIHLLLVNCIKDGTIPFSILARYGFIGSSMIRGLVEIGIIDENEKNRFLNSIETVATEMLIEMNKVLDNKLPLDNFLSKYGHLRPNSYNIESYSYNEKPDYYLPKNNNKQTVGSKIEYNFNEKIIDLIDAELIEMDFDAEQLLSFIKKTISAREFSKFQFTKTLSKILDLVSEYGDYYGFSRREMSFISIQDIINIESKALYTDPQKYLKNLITEGFNWYSKSNEIKTPSFISSKHDFDIIEKDENSPNFVSTKSIDGEPFYLNKLDNNKNITGKIILIESADPGYDWIFLYNIKGLVTMYGGAASHMTIRCSEFGLPAAIGCGDSLFNELTTSNLINLDCASKKITILR